jgi:hypothetical protein
VWGVKSPPCKRGGGAAHPAVDERELRCRSLRCPLQKKPVGVHSTVRPAEERVSQFDASDTAQCVYAALSRHASTHCRQKSVVPPAMSEPPAQRAHLADDAPVTDATRSTPMGDRSIPASVKGGLVGRPERNRQPAGAHLARTAAGPARRPWRPGFEREVRAGWWCVPGRMDQKKTAEVPASWPPWRPSPSRLCCRGVHGQDGQAQDHAPVERGCGVCGGVCRHGRLTRGFGGAWRWRVEGTHGGGGSPLGALPPGLPDG